MTPEDFVDHFFTTIPPSMRVVRAYMRESAAPELSVPEFRVLLCINKGKHFIGEIAQHHGVSQPAMSKMVHQLEKKALVYRNPYEQDHRYSILKLTKDGSQLFKKIRSKARKSLGEKAKKSLSEKELGRMVRALKEIEELLPRLNAEVGA